MSMYTPRTSALEARSLPHLRKKASFSLASFKLTLLMLSGALEKVSISKSLSNFLLICAISSSAFCLAFSEKKPPSSSTVRAGPERLFAWALAVPENDSQPTIMAGTKTQRVKCTLIVELLYGESSRFLIEPYQNGSFLSLLSGVGALLERAG